MILPDSRSYGQSYALYVLANTDQGLTASEISGFNEDASTPNIRKALRALFEQGYLIRRKAMHHPIRGRRPYEYTIKPADLDKYIGFEESEWEQIDE